MRVVFRVDASAVIGAGHVVRCLTLAGALRDAGVDLLFVSRALTGHMHERIRAEGHALAVLPGDRDHDWRTDAQETIAALGVTDVRPDWIVVDHYDLGEDWERALRESVRKVLVIDDLAAAPHACDLLLNQNYVPGLAERYATLVPSTGRLLLGPEYALLQPAYRAARKSARPRAGAVRRVFVYFGGADRNDLTLRTVEAFVSLERQDVVADVVVSASMPRARALRELARDHANVVLHESLPTLAPLMLEADLAVGAGGTTSWERCCLGLPAIVVTLADNQRPIARSLHDAGIVRWLGDDADVTAAEIASALTDVLCHGLDEDWSRRCLAIVDGAGAERVCDAMFGRQSLQHGETRPNEGLRVRRATMRDGHMLLEWRNDPAVRAASRDTSEVALGAHLSWLRSVLSDPDRWLFVIEEGTEAVGTVRVDRRPDGQELSWTVAPGARGRGIGTRMVALVAGMVPGDVYAEVKPENVASAAIARQAGLVAEGERDGILRFVRPHQ